MKFSEILNVKTVYKWNFRQRVKVSNPGVTKNMTCPRQDWKGVYGEGFAKEKKTTGPLNTIIIASWGEKFAMAEPIHYA